MAGSGSVVLSTLEFDVLWEYERLPLKHVALDVPSPGKTHTERARLVAATFDALEQRGLATGERAVAELADWLNLLAYPQVSVDGWVWTDHKITALAAGAGGQGLLAVVDGSEVWLIPARDTALAEAAVSIAGDIPAGPGHSVSVPTDVLHAADVAARGDPLELSAALIGTGVSGADAKALATMLEKLVARGQFGVERAHRDQRRHRADRVVAFHDTPGGRYVYLAKPSSDGRMWSTITPADNARLAGFVTELLDEV